MTKSLPLDVLGVSHRTPWKNKNAVYCLQISASVPEICKFEKCLKYANEMTDDIIHSTQYSTSFPRSLILPPLPLLAPGGSKMRDPGNEVAQYYIKYMNRAILANLQHRPLKLGRLIVLQETHLWLLKIVPMATHSFPVPTHLISMLVIFSLKNVKLGHELNKTYLYTCWDMYMRHH